jgi:hypothetical protein
MSNETPKPDSNLKSAIDATTALVKEIPVYQDVVQPSAQQVGKSLETVAKTVNIALAPIKAFVWGYEQIEKFISTRVAEKLKAVPQENIITPSTHIAVPVIEALRYTGNDNNLSELFANLLATSMDKSVAHKAHPAYVNIIKNMCSDEAQLLTFLANHQYALPVIDIIRRAKKTGSYHILRHNFSLLDMVLFFDHIELLPAYIDNLCRLGILAIPSGIQLSNDSQYIALEKTKEVKELDTLSDQDESEIAFKRKVIDVTSLGKEFCTYVVLGKDNIST